MNTQSKKAQVLAFVAQKLIESAGRCRDEAADAAYDGLINSLASETHKAARLVRQAESLLELSTGLDVAASTVGEGHQAQTVCQAISKSLCDTATEYLKVAKLKARLTVEPSCSSTGRAEAEHDAFTSHLRHYALKVASALALDARQAVIYKDTAVILP